MIHRPGNGHGSTTDLTSAVLLAKSGRRSDVQALLDRLETAELYTPLARSLPGVEDGAQVELTDDITIVPHMLVDDEGHVYCALFTRPEFMEPFGVRLGWGTDGGPLQFVAFPAKTALDMTFPVIDEKDILGLVINAGDASELVLRHSEVGALLSGRAIPLVGYVSEIHGGSVSETLVAETAAPPPPEFMAALEAQIATLPAVLGHELTRSFNPDRDLEPHLTLHLTVMDGDVDKGDIVAVILDGIKDKLPPPGYIDIVFED